MEQPSEKQPPQLNPILRALYIPAKTQYEADDLLDGGDILEAIAPYCETSREWLFTQLQEIGFKSINVQNTLYWLIKYNLSAVVEKPGG